MSRRPVRAPHVEGGQGDLRLDELALLAMRASRRVLPARVHRHAMARVSRCAEDDRLACLGRGRLIEERQARF
eukprot:6673205-Prymnesium_polylepis.1